MDAFSLYHPGFIKPTHRECLICACITRHRTQLHVRNLVKMRAVAASLPLPYVPGRESEATKQETPGLAGPEVSTAPALVATEDRRAADVHRDTGPRQ